MRASHSLILVLTALIVAGAVMNTHAQERPFRESVSIPVDPEVAKSLRMVRDQWDNGPDAVTISSLLELCDAHGDKLVLQDRGVAGGVARFVRLQALADELAAGLTPELRATFRQRIDLWAEPWWKAWQTTGDVRHLERIITRAFYSSWGDDAVAAMAQWEWDHGHFTAARRHWQRLLTVTTPDNPDAPLTPATIRARLVLCDIVGRRWETAEASLAEFIKEYPNEEGTLAGQTGLWSKLLTDTLQQAHNWQPQHDAEDIVTLGGNFARQHRAPKSLDIGGELWSISLPNPRLPSAQRNPLFPAPLPLAFHPAVLDDLVIVNDGRQIHAWNLYSGKAYWDASREDGDVIYPVVADPSPMMPVRPTVGQAQWSVTVANGRVYARMGSAVTTPAPTEFRDLPAELVCLDISQGEGQLLWKHTADDLATLADELPLWRWEGSPVVENGRVYSVLSRRRPQLEWSIVCLDAESGLMLWQRPIGITRPTPPDHENRVSSLLLTAGDGQLFLSTGWGAVVAIDPPTGTVNWAVTYETAPGGIGGVGAIPPVYVDGRLYVALLDGDRLGCIDAATGRFLWSRPLTEPIREILGVAQDRLIVSGRSLWGFDAPTGQLAWSVPATEPDDWGYGRGALAGDQVLWATRDALWFIDQRTGALLREHPLVGAIMARTGGNVVVSHGVILIAGADRLTAYGEYPRLREPLEQPLSDRRRELQREMKLAEIDWATGANTQAAERWDRVRQQAEAKTHPEHRRASARASLLPGRRSPRPTVRITSAVTATPVAAVTHRPTAVVESASTGFWRRVETKRLNIGTRGVFPAVAEHDLPLGVLIEDSPLQLWNPFTREKTSLAQVDQHVVWWGQWPQRFVIVMDDELLVYDRASKSLLHRQPRPQCHDGKASVEWVVHPHGLLMLSPPKEIALFDVMTGEWRWQRRVDSGGWQREIGWNTQRLLIHPRGMGGTELWDVATGQTLRREHPPTAPFKMSPVFLGSEDDYLTVTEDDRLVGRSTQTSRRWEYNGVVSQSYTAPWVFTDDDDVIAVMDGSRVVRISRESGWTRWSTMLAQSPLRVPVQQAAVWNHRIYAAAAGMIRAIDLETGSLLWTATYDASGQQTARCVILDGNTTDAVLVVLPFGDSESSPVRDHLDFYSAETGQRSQSLRLLSPTHYLDAATVDSHRVLLMTDRDVVAYQR